MGIDLSLRLTRRKAPAEPRDDADVTIASARAFIPVAWVLLFDPDDVAAAASPWGELPSALARADAALARLRARAPVLRAVGGAHADGLAGIEAALASAGAGAYVQLVVYELLESWTPQSRETLRKLVGSTTAPRLAEWEPALSWAGLMVKRERLALAGHGGTLEDAVTGRVHHEAPVALQGARLTPRLEWAWSAQPLMPRNAAASVARGLSDVTIEPEHLEVLTAVLLVDEAPCPPETYARLERLHVDALRPLLVPYEGVTLRARPEHPSAALRAAAERAARALAAGEPDPFGGLRDARPGEAAHALASLRLPFAERRKLRRALLGVTERLAAPLAEAVGDVKDCPAVESLALLTWCDGGASPKRAKTPEAVLACRIATLGSRFIPLSVHDPLGVAERIADHRVRLQYVPPAEAPGPLAAFAVARSLRLVRDTAREMLLVACEYQDVDEVPPVEELVPALVSYCVLAAGSIEDPARASLRARAGRAVDDALLAGIDRSTVRLALGDVGALDEVLTAAESEPGRVADVVVAIASGRAGEAALPWLLRVAEGRADASLVLLATAPGDAGARAAALRGLESLPGELKARWAQYTEGVITHAETEPFIVQGRRAADLVAPLAAQGDATASRVLAALRAELQAIERAPGPAAQ